MSTNSYVVTKKNNHASLWKTKSPLLGRLVMELTERCNNNCIHCCINLPVDDMNAKNKELSTEEVKNILKEAAALGYLTVRFTGGEPLLREDFTELYLFARRLGLTVLIFTNATLITPQLADLFTYIVPLEKIEISVYGMKKSSYEAVTRTAGSFDACWRGINLLLEKKVPFVVKAALLPPNKEEIDEFEKWAATIPGMDKPPSYSMFFHLRNRREEKKNRCIRSLRLSTQEGLKVLMRRKDEYTREIKEFCVKFMHSASDKLFSCGSGLGSGCVDAYGNFQSCMMLRYPECVYNLKAGSFKDALENFFPKMREKKANDPEYLRRCAKCFLRGLCEQCPANSWMEHGTLDTPVEYLCEIAHAQARFLGLIEENEKAWEVEDWKERINNFTNS
ncbi:MAG: radical SAM protein [Candidatus Omnitrophota bacterium]|nr:radical SAM protein [Candidatus Omnitrophota bacterium]